MLSASSSRLRATTSLLSLGNELSYEVVAALSVGVAIATVARSSGKWQGCAKTKCRGCGNTKWQGHMARTSGQVKWQPSGLATRLTGSYTRAIRRLYAGYTHAKYKYPRPPPTAREYKQEF